MARGGKRDGAGRRPKLEKEEYGEIRVGQFCEQRHREIMNSNFDNEWRDFHKNYDEQIEKLRKIPIHKRKELLKGRYLQRHKEEVEEALGEDYMAPISKGDDDHVIDPKYVDAPSEKRPYGFRGKIISEAIIWVKDEYGVDVGPDYVDRCWKEYRALESEIRDENKYPV